MLLSWPTKIYFVKAWCDLWVGVAVDAEKKRLYVLPVPCLGFCIEWEKR